MKRSESSVRIPYAVVRHSNLALVTVTEYAYAPVARTVESTQITFPLPAMGLVVRIPFAQPALPPVHLRRWLVRGWMVVHVENGTGFASHVGLGVDEASQWTAWHYAVERAEGVPAMFNTAELAKEMNMVAAVCRTDIVRFCADARVLATHLPDWSTEPVDFYARHFAQSGLTNMGLGFPVQLCAASPSQPTPLTSAQYCAQRTLLPDSSDAYCLPLILLDVNPMDRTIVAQCIAWKEGTQEAAVGNSMELEMSADEDPCGPRRRGYIAALCQRMCTRWSMSHPVLIWRRARPGPSDAMDRRWDTPMQRQPLPPHVILCTEWVHGEHRLGQSPERLMHAVCAATALMRETQAPMRHCLHHVLNMRWRDKAEGRGRRLVDAWFAVTLVRAGIHWVPWRSHQQGEAGHELQNGVIETDRKRERSSVLTMEPKPTLLSNEDTMDGFSMEEELANWDQKRARLDSTPLDPMATEGNTRDISDSRMDSRPADRLRLAASDSESTRTASNSPDSMPSIVSDGGDVAPARLGVHWAGHGRVLVELDFLACYASIIALYDMCPSKSVSGADLTVAGSAPTAPTASAILSVMRRRAEAKRDGRTALDVALKSLLVCIYGVTGVAKSRFFSPLIRSRIAERSRHHIQDLRRSLSVHYGAIILQSITDSVMCSIEPGELATFLKHSPYMAEDAILRLGPPVFMDALWCVNKTARIWLPQGGTEVTAKTCRGVYPCFAMADGYASDRFLQFASALLSAPDGENGSEVALTSTLSSLFSPTPADVQRLASHVANFCGLSILKRWPGFAAQIRPVMRQYGIGTPKKGNAEAAGTSSSLFPTLPPHTLLRLDAYLGDLTISAPVHGMLGM